MPLGGWAEGLLRAQIVLSFMNATSFSRVPFLKKKKLACSKPCIPSAHIKGMAVHTCVQQKQQRDMRLEVSKKQFPTL